MEIKVINEQFSQHEIYSDIEKDQNSHEIIKDGEVHIVQTPESGGNTLETIEKFVKEVISTQSPAFQYNYKIGHRTIIQRLSLSKYFRRFHQYIDEYTPRKIFSPNVTLFFDTLKKLKIINSDTGEISLPIPDDPISFDFLINEIRSGAENVEFKNRISKSEFNYKRNLKSASNYVESLFDKYARLLVLRIDLAFTKESQSGNPSDFVETAQKYLDKFLNARRGNKIFASVVGYIWKLEYGKTKGLHFHFIFFMDGSKAKKDEFRTSEIGKYWIKITEGKGYFFNVNLNKRHYEKHGIGVGMIDHTDTDMRNNLLRIIQYFFKKDQYLMERYVKKTRTFGRGEMPKERVTKLGRPRSSYNK